MLGKRKPRTTSRAGRVILPLWSCGGKSMQWAWCSKTRVCWRTRAQVAREATSTASDICRPDDLPLWLEVDGQHWEPASLPLQVHKVDLDVGQVLMMGRLDVGEEARLDRVAGPAIEETEDEEGVVCRVPDDGAENVWIGGGVKGHGGCGGCESERS